MAPVLPPRPKKPVTTGISSGAPASSVRPSLMLGRVSSYCTSPLENSSEVTMPSFQASCCRARTPWERRKAAKMRVDMRSPKDTSVS